MNKKILLTIVTMILLLSICVYSFAMDNVVNDVRDFVGDTENTVENVAGDAVNGVRDGINAIEGGTENVINDVEDGMEDTENTITGTTTDDDNDGYTASMTSADQSVDNLTSNMWTWIVIGVFAIAIALMIWYYVRNKKSSNMYIDDDQDE